MPVGFEAYNEDSSVMFTTELITYGLIKSGYLVPYAKWGTYMLRSEQLNPGDESSWGYYTGNQLNDQIVGIAVDNTIAPIFFLSGDGMPCGVVGTGTTKTFLFHGCVPNTKIYVFDKMQDLGLHVGMECVDAASNLTFTTDMPPLNIVAAIDPPAIGPLYPGGPYNPPRPINGPPYVGGAISQTRPWHSTDKVWIKGYAYVASGVSTEIATCLTFSRGGWQYHNGNVTGSYEGCGGNTDGRVKFYFMEAYVSTNLWSGGSGPGWGDIPRDRAPQALVIRTSDYPFPYR